MAIKAHSPRNIRSLRFEAICSLVRDCGKIIRSADRGNIRIDEKSGPADFVTDYDKKVQDMLQRGLADIVPDAHFIGEEGSTRPFASEGRFFIVDPIDGTTNFIKDFHASAISVALSVDGAVELGISSTTRISTSSSPPVAVARLLSLMYDSSLNFPHVLTFVLHLQLPAIRE